MFMFVISLLSPQEIGTPIRYCKFTNKIPYLYNSDTLH